MIEVKNLTYNYKQSASQEIRALANVSLAISPGEWVAIVGSNGSGKSTLAKHLNALLQPTDGCVTVDNMDTANLSNIYEIRRRVGMVFQNPENQLIAPTVEEDVAFGPENMGLAQEEILQRIELALAYTNISHLRFKAPHQLSGGQKQRVAIAGVLSMLPAYLVLDEATSMLDPIGRQEVLETIAWLHSNKGLAVVMITHDMEEAMLAQRMIVMHRGQILAEGSPQVIFSQPDVLLEARLELPPIPAMANALALSGIPLPQGIMSEEAMVKALCRLKYGN